MLLLLFFVFLNHADMSVGMKLSLGKSNTFLLFTLKFGMIIYSARMHNHTDVKSRSTKKLSHDFQ